MATTILTFRKQDGTLYSFTDDEVYEVFIETIQKTSLLRLLNRAPILTYLDAPYNVVSVKILPQTVTAIQSIEALKDITDPTTMTLYYSDGSTIAEYFPVRIDPNIMIPYFAGEPAYEFIVLKFYESSSGKSVMVYEFEP